MAKVVKIDKTKAKRRTHDRCGAVIEYFENEVEAKYVSDYGGGGDYVYSLKCPNCGEKITWS